MAKNSNQTKAAPAVAAAATPDDVLGALPASSSSGSDNGPSTADLQKAAVASLADVPADMLPADVSKPVPGEFSDAGPQMQTVQQTVESGTTTTVSAPVSPAGRYRVTCQPATPVTTHEIELDVEHPEAAWKEWLKLNGVSATSADRQITRLSDKTGAPPVLAPTIKPVYKPAPVEMSEVVDSR